MKPRIVRKLGMKRRNQDVLALGRHDPPSYLAQHLDPGSHVLEERRPDKHPYEGLLKALYLKILLEGVHLPPEPVALDERVHQPEQGLPRTRGCRRCEHHPRTRPPYRSALVEKASDAVQKARLDHQVPYSRRLPSRHDEPSETLKVLYAAHLDGLDPEFFQDLAVLPEVPLEREPSDPLWTLRRLPV